MITKRTTRWAAGAALVVFAIVGVGGALNALQGHTSAVVPLLDHLAASDRVLAFEVIAEPEWGIVEERLVGRTSPVGYQAHAMRISRFAARQQMV